MAAHRALVEARGLSKRYCAGAGAAAVDALRGVDLTVRAGELLAVAGPSGSGKSTLLHILGCLERPTAGSCLLEGRDVARLGDAELSRVRNGRIGFVFQAFHLLPHRSVLDNVLLPFLYGTVRRPQARRLARRAIERVGLAHREGHLPRMLSGGEMQRAAIARALAGDPPLVLADEPTGNLDSAGGEAILALFREINRQGTTVVVVTHNRELAAGCDRTVHLRDGRLAQPGAAP